MDRREAARPLVILLAILVLGSLSNTRLMPGLLLSALMFPAVLLVEYAVMVASRMPLPAPQVQWLQAPVLFALLFVPAFCEEVTWSATLLEPLQARYGALGTGLLIGGFGAAWHVIPFAQANPSVSWVFGQCVFTVGFRVVVAWIYNVSGHSLVAAVVCHTAYNTAWQLFPNQDSGYDPWITAALTWFVVVVVSIFGAWTLAGRHPTSASS
jgi:membrane protease YdiL (CAAX protease family)